MSRRPAAPIALLAAAVAAGVVAFVIVGGDGGDAPAPTAPGVAHVHGLGIDPGDGALIVATHLGTFRIPRRSNDAARIGTSFQDTMGFTVVGSGHYLGSGHPDVRGMQAGQPARLGLIESTDAGETWTSVSLAGEVDFHALAFAHDQVYGWDSGTGRFLVSSDRREWQTRSTLELYGFAVDPADAEHIVGAGRQGVLESTDGGRSWLNVEGSPPVVTLSWHRVDGLWGADADGAVWHSEGTKWQRVGRLPGEPQAFLVAGGVLYAAVHDDDDRTAIYHSKDGGETWRLRYRDREQ